MGLPTQFEYPRRRYPRGSARQRLARRDLRGRGIGSTFRAGARQFTKYAKPLAIRVASEVVRDMIQKPGTLGERLRGVDFTKAALAGGARYLLGGQLPSEGTALVSKAKNKNLRTLMSAARRARGIRPSASRIGRPII